ncbi:glycosyl hydrolase [Frondihabitans peucedani]|uniref:GH26 domain-containing protein n=1 Tax=Frondihabitans peucedani TaxID=598626 RepID=A0ABP8DY25_9MICO
MSDLTSPSGHGSTMITPLSTGTAWWTTGKKNSRRSALGATAIVVLLALISWLVWMSPTDNVVRHAVTDVVKPIAGSMALKNDRASLLTQLVSTKSQVNDQSAQLAEQQKQLQAALGKAKALESQLATAKSEAATATGKASSLKAQADAGATKSAFTASDGGGSTLGGGSTNGDFPAGDGSAAGGSGGTGTGTGGTGTGTGTGAGTGSGSGSGSGDGSGGGTGGAPTGPVVPSTPTLASIKNPTSRYFGLYTAQSPFSWSEFDDVTKKVGEQPNSAGYFQGWDQDFRADAVQRSWAKGDLPIITWESQSSTAGNNQPDQPEYSLGNIIKGDFDAYLKKYADAIVTNGQPVGIRLDQEMNATWYPWSEDDGHGNSVNGNSAGQYKLMWQHVHDVFAGEGANEYVNWIWAPNRINNLTKTHKTLEYNASLYPGDEYVDWIGMSGYERPSGDGPQDGSFADTFGDTLSILRQIADKPIFLAEVGATEGGGLKAGWITNLFNALAAPENKDIIGFSWFSLTVTTTLNGQLVTNDWRLNSTATALQAFATGISRTDIDYALRPVTPAS